MSSSTHILSSLCRQLRRTCPDLENPITRESSLTRDLHVDSTQLTALLAFARREIADVDFGPWYAEASRDGRDTVGSLAAFLQRAVETMTAEAVAGEP
jgi:hypothetical protein